MQIKDYEIKLPTLATYPQFFEMSEQPRKLVSELIKISVFKNGVLVGDDIPLDDAIEIATAISGLLNPN